MAPWVSGAEMDRCNAARSVVVPIAARKPRGPSDQNASVPAARKPALSLHPDAPAVVPLARSGGSPGSPAPSTAPNATSSGRGRPGSPVGGTTKRLFDIVVASVSLLIMLPLLVMVAALVFSQGGGRVLYRHRRIGYAGKPFGCLKFRTMVSHGEEVLARHLAEDPAAAREWTETRKLRNDPRVTPIGRLLRESSLDELPQLVNVLAGDMSIVGPRPIVVEEIERYGAHFEAYEACRPGITGPWQVNGRSNCSYAERIALDVAYSASWSIVRDCGIILKTPRIVVARTGSY
jgi:exopolysaccharide production protein ExoY